MLGRLGGASFRNPRKIVAAWVVVVVAVFGAVAALGPAFDASFEIPNSEGRRGFDALDAHFGGFGSGQSGSIVFRSESGIDAPDVRVAMEEMFATVAAIEGVIVTSPYQGPQGARQISDDRQVAFAALSLSVDLDFTETALIGVEIGEFAPDLPGLQIEIGGTALAEFEPPDSELIGLALAIVVLIFAFGSVVAMGLPIVVAVTGVGVGGALIILASHAITMPDFATTIGALIGIGVGIDYALFIVTRYREVLAAGRSPEQSTVTAMDTAGRAVVFAGLAVIISLLGMLIMNMAFITGMAVGAAVTVAVTMIASVTLLPAMLGFTRESIEVTRWRGLIASGLVAIALLGVGLGVPIMLLAIPLAALVFVAGIFVPALKRLVPHRPQPPIEQTPAYRWSRVVQSHPWIALIVGSALLIVLALPVLSLRLGFSDESNYAESTTTFRAYDLLADGFGPGFNGPLILTAEVEQPSDRAALDPLVAALVATPGVASVGRPFPSNPADPANSVAYLIQVVPTTSPQDEATTDLVKALRHDVVPRAVEGTTLEVNVTGTVAANIDFSSYLAERIIIFFAAVLVLSFLLLMAVFRSVLVPVKAVIMNLLSIGAAYGIIVAVFQWGWFSGTLGIEGAPIEPFLPMMMFAIVFGLSMDYEVFLLSRIKEHFDRTGDAVGSVADGLASTARVITAAAVIMVVVFGSFVLEDDRIIQLFGFGLAIAVLLDATVVRLLLVPAAMELLGTKNWWLPGWLDRVLPTISIEGETAPDPVAVAATDD
jgi:RND superfamily putative drug exporter